MPRRNKNAGTLRPKPLSQFRIKKMLRGIKKDKKNVKPESQQ